MLCKENTIIGLVGPTGVGKTDLGVELARALGSSIISVDARQLYCYMDIGTAKPTPQQQQQVHHHFIDCIKPDEAFSSGAFGRAGRDLINDMRKKGEIPVLVGGAGFYLQALLDGFFADENDYSSQRHQLQDQLETRGLPSLWEELGQLDPMAQSRLAPNDAQRIIRALEVARTGRGALSQLWQQRPQPIEAGVLLFGLYRDRAELYQRIDKRVELMVASGLIDEVKGIMAKGYSPESYGLQTMGYTEIVQVLQGRMDLGAAKERIKQRTRQYAKRQMTWFRRDRRIRWLDLPACGEAGALLRIKAQMKYQLGEQIALDS